jgi:hypothetical protein
VPSRAVVSRINMTLVILIVVIGSLCFSVGEGLRLTPFPISDLIGIEASTTSETAKASDQISNYKYGPLDVPTQNQKRNKRQAVLFDSPPASHTCEIPTSLHSSATHEPFDIVSVLMVSPSAGRAPPLVS